MTCTDVLAPAAKLAAEKASVWLGAVPVIDQPVTGAASDQLTPEPPGGGSLIATVVAGPTPVLRNVTTKPICEPALTVAESAVLLSVRVGGRTTVIGTSNPSQLHFDLFAYRVPKRKPSGLLVTQLGAVFGLASG